MITRRDFVVKTAATASSPMALDAAEEPDVRLPLKALPRVRTLFTKPTGDGRLLLFSDGPKTPSKLIKPETLERAFGPRVLSDEFEPVSVGTGKLSLMPRKDPATPLEQRSDFA